MRIQVYFALVHISHTARIFLIVLSFLFLSGCIAYHDRATERNFDSSLLPKGEGIVFLSLTVEKSRPLYSTYSLKFQNKDTGGVGRFSYNSAPLAGGNKNLDWDNSSSRGMVKAMTLPAGNYVLVNLSIFYGEATFEAAEDFSVPFTVVPGRATYLGSVDLIPQMGRNIFGIPIPAGGYLAISSSSARDISIFRTKYPNISPDLIQSRPMRSGSVF